jgi:hypothetical protein
MASAVLLAGIDVYGDLFLAIAAQKSAKSFTGKQVFLIDLFRAQSFHQCLDQRR